LARWAIPLLIPVTVIVGGDAAAPAGSGVREVYGHVGIVLEIDPTTDLIVAVDAVYITELARDFVRRLLIGYCLADGFPELQRRITEHVLFHSQGALVVALRTAVQRYYAYKAEPANR